MESSLHSSVELLARLGAKFRFYRCIRELVLPKKVMCATVGTDDSVEVTILSRVLKKLPSAKLLQQLYIILNNRLQLT